MRKIFVALLCLLLVTFCACNQTKPPEETTTITQATAEITTFEPTEVSMPTITIKTDPEDPFSTIVSEQVDWLMKKYIETNDIGYHSRNYGYALYDTDGRGTTALLIGGENPYGYVNEIYTLQNGVAEKKLDMGLDDNSIIMFKTGYIRTSNLYGSGACGYYRFEDGQLRLVAGLGYYDGDFNGSVFRVDPTGGERDFFFDFIPDGTEVPITDEECRRLVKEFLGDREPAELDWKPLAEYGR